MHIQEGEGKGGGGLGKSRRGGGINKKAHKIKGKKGVDKT